MTKTTIIYASKDTFISSNSNSKTLNFGKDGNLLIDGTCKIFIYFYLSSIPENATITSAKLHLYLYNSYLYNTTVTIKKLDSAFYEYTVNSDNAPSSSILDLEDTSKKIITPIHINKFVTFNNLTKTVSSWHCGILSNYGFELSSSENYLLSFFSRDYSEDKLCPNLEIEYNIDLHDIPTLKSNISLETIYITSTEPISTRVFDISQALSFTYFICNTITNPNLLPSPNDIFVSLKTCNSLKGPFEPTGNPISIGSNTNKAIEVPSVNKYVCLSINGYENTTVTVDGVYNFFSARDPSTACSCKIVNDTIILTMTKKLTGYYTDPAAFSITTPEYFDLFPLIKIVEASVSNFIVTLKCSPNRLFFPNATLTYSSTTIDKLTGKDGDVSNFSNYKIDIDLDAFHLDRNFTPANWSNSDKTYNASKVESFVYSIVANGSSGNTTCELLRSDTRDGTPIKVLSFYPSINPLKIPIPKDYKYVHLTYIKADAYLSSPSLSVSVDYMVSPYLSPATIEKVEIIEYGTKLLLTFNKPLNEIANKLLTTPPVFTIDAKFGNLQIPFTVTNLEALNTTVTLTLDTGIPLDTILNRKPSDYINISYKASDSNYLSGFNGDVVDFSNFPINIALEKVTITERFSSSQSNSNIKTSIYSIKKTCYFNYVITNNSDFSDITVTLLGSTTVNGEFTAIEGYSPLTIGFNKPIPLTIFNSPEYICLSIYTHTFTASESETTSVVATYAALADNMPSRVDFY